MIQVRFKIHAAGQWKTEVSEKGSISARLPGSIVWCSSTAVSWMIRWSLAAWRLRQIPEASRFYGGTVVWIPTSGSFVKGDNQEAE